MSSGPEEGDAMCASKAECEDPSPAISLTCFKAGHAAPHPSSGSESESDAASGGLTATYFNNSATAGKGVSSAVLPSLESIPSCTGGACAAPSSLLLTGRVAPPAAGNYGFNLTFDPPLPYPSPDAYSRLWVHDHLLYPNSTAQAMGGKKAGDGTPLWIPLPPRALNLDLTAIEHVGAAPLASYEVRLEYVCIAAKGCGSRKLTLQWTTYDYPAVAALLDSTHGQPPPPPPSPPFTPIPSTALLPDQSAPEIQRRSLYSKLQNGWGTFCKYTRNPSAACDELTCSDR